jgi:hypothetical protein
MSSQNLLSSGKILAHSYGGSSCSAASCSATSLPSFCRYFYFCQGGLSERSCVLRPMATLLWKPTIRATALPSPRNQNQVHRAATSFLAGETVGFCADAHAGPLSATPAHYRADLTELNRSIRHASVHGAISVIATPSRPAVSSDPIMRAAFGVSEATSGCGGACP